MYPPTSKDFGPLVRVVLPLRTALPSAEHVPPQARSPRLGAVHPSDGPEESIYYALLLYSPKRSGPKCPCRPATPSSKDGVLLLHHILDNESFAPV